MITLNKVDRMMLIENIESKNWEPALTVDELKELKKKKWLDMHKRNKCSVCAKAFEFNEVYFSEHLKDGSTRYICSNCCKGSKDLDMCANRHRFSHLIPVPKTKLWRYMDLAKFLSVLETSSLFFTRIDHFKDSYEGALGVLSNEEAWLDENLAIRKKVRRGEYLNLSEKELHEIVKKEFDEVRQGEPEFRTSYYVNCWHASDFESEAMWQLYTRDNKQGIAIQTTFEHLYNAFCDYDNLHYGLVNYINFKKYNNGTSNKKLDSYTALWCKRESFAHEREFRVMIQDIRKLAFRDRDKSLRVDINQLIENVYVSPEADKWFVDLINDIIMNRYHLDLNVIQSELSQPPFY